MRRIYRSSLAYSLAGTFIILFVLGPSASNLKPILHPSEHQGMTGMPFQIENHAPLSQTPAPKHYRLFIND